MLSNVHIIIIIKINKKHTWDKEISYQIIDLLKYNLKSILYSNLLNNKNNNHNKNKKKKKKLKLIIIKIKENNLKYNKNYKKISIRTKRIN